MFFIRKDQQQQQQQSKRLREVPLHVRDALLRALDTYGLCRCDDRVDADGGCEGAECDARAVEWMHEYMRAYTTTTHGDKTTLRVRGGDGVVHSFSVVSNPLDTPTTLDIVDGVVGRVRVTPNV